MVVNLSTEVRSAQQLMNRGRFADAVLLLERHQRLTARRQDPFAEAFLADALQRVGQNDRAQALATRNLPKAKHTPTLAARYHFVLGNISRERGYLTRAAEHFQMAVSLAGTDFELACWSQLRSMLAIAELSGVQAAMTRLDEVKRSLIRLGDARAFATLHLWLVEAESTRGNLASARRHLQIAASLLSNVEDLWLLGFMAINSSALNYYSADTAEAQRCAEAAIEYAQKSGHRPTLLAAQANLGNIKFSLGDLDTAETCFRAALSYCEKGSVNELALLDNIAQVQLQLGRLEECKSLVSRLEDLADHSLHAKRRHYTACALLTKARLSLREGCVSEALDVTDRLSQLLAGLPRTRIITESHLLRAETLLANGDPDAAARTLVPVFTMGGQLPPDLLAHRERLTGRTLLASAAFGRARIHLERGIRIFDVLGHSLGVELSKKELLSVPKPGTNSPLIASQRSLDRMRALLDLRSRAELFGTEAVSFLEELACAESIDLSISADGQRNTLVSIGAAPESKVNDAPVSLVLNAAPERTVTLSFIPLKDACSQLTAAAFQDMIRQIVSAPSADSVPSDREIAWDSNGGPLSNNGAVFASDAMLGVLRIVKQIAPTNVSVLITGETGTGKEVVARTIHDQSLRSGKPFLALNCAAVPRDLLESQLFGYRKGAFSGASENYQGVVRAANGGTLFLDEVGEIPLEMQAKLLRFLEMNEVHPVGESHPVKVDVRLLFATNGDLENAVAQNRFRRDLYYRLSVVPIRVPPLRERKEEVPILANVFAQRFSLELSKDAIQLSAPAMERLILHSWPGNVRELSNEIRRLTVLKESGACISPEDLSITPKSSRQHDKNEAEIVVSMNQPLEFATSRLESEMIKHALQRAHGHVSSAAAMLGISRKGLYLKRLRLGLTETGTHTTR